MRDVRESLPRSTRDFIARFEQDLDREISEDQRYEFRMHLVPKLGRPKTEADRAFTFVRESDLTAAERATITRLGRSGQVIVREQLRDVGGADKLRPGGVVEAVSERIPFKFDMSHFVTGWKKTKCRPATNSAHPERTETKYCVYIKPFRSYAYTQAFVDKLVREASTEARFKKFYGKAPIRRAKK